MSSTGTANRSNGFVDRFADGDAMVVSAVTAANDHAAAKSVTENIQHSWYLDLNSASPGMNL